jgi:nitrogen regulatory protein PII
MYYMVLVIVDDLNDCPSLLEAWNDAEVPGITVLESTGMGRLRQGRNIRDDVPMMPSLSEIFRSRAHHHRTVFSVVEGEEKVDQLIAITERILGDLNQPDTGVLFVLPVARVVGYHGASERAKGGQSPSD